MSFLNVLPYCLNQRFSAVVVFFLLLKLFFYNMSRNQVWFFHYSLFSGSLRWSQLSLSPHDSLSAYEFTHTYYLLWSMVWSISLCRLQWLSKAWQQWREAAESLTFPHTINLCITQTVNLRILWQTSKTELSTVNVFHILFTVESHLKLILHCYALICSTSNIHSAEAQK